MDGFKKGLGDPYLSFRRDDFETLPLGFKVVKVQEDGVEVQGFKLRDVQGRLIRTFWEQFNTFPCALWAGCTELQGCGEGGYKDT